MVKNMRVCVCVRERETERDRWKLPTVSCFARHVKPGNLFRDDAHSYLSIRETSSIAAGLKDETEHCFHD